MTLFTISLLAMVLIAAAFGLIAWTKRSLEREARVDLGEQVQEVQALVQSRVIAPVLPSSGTRNGKLQVFDAAGKEVAESPGIAANARFNPFDLVPGNKESWRTLNGSELGLSDTDRYLVIAQAAPTTEGRFVVYGATNLQSADQAETTLRNLLLAGIPLILGFGAWLVWLAVATALRPVEIMRREVDEIEATALHRRVRPPGSADEIDRLARTMNGMLSRFESSVTRRQRFSADASHELRSPLASARAQLEVALAYPGQVDWVETATGVLAEIERLDVLSGELLTLARLELGGDLDLHPVDVNAMIASEMDTPSSSPISARFRSSGLPLTVNGNPELLVRVLRNLLANARRHATSSIDIDTRSEGGSAVIRVTNDGRPIPAGMHEAIFEPFTRLDDARSVDAGGAGLGLAIVRNIVSDHGGTVTSTPALSGACFVVALPLLNS